MKCKTFYKFICKILYDHGHNHHGHGRLDATTASTTTTSTRSIPVVPVPVPLLLTLGDEKQTIYQFLDSDTRYLTLTPYLFNKFTTLPWKSFNLSTSY